VGGVSEDELGEGAFPQRDEWPQHRLDREMPTVLGFMHSWNTASMWLRERLTPDHIVREVDGLTNPWNFGPGKREKIPLRRRGGRSDEESRLVEEQMLKLLRESDRRRSRRSSRGGISPGRAHRLWSSAALQSPRRRRRRRVAASRLRPLRSTNAASNRCCRCHRYRGSIRRSRSSRGARTSRRRACWGRS
jgi:hypothetical protein